MKAIHDMEMLRQTILELEATKKAQGEAFKEEFHNILESLKPSHLIKNTMKEVFDAPDIRSGLLSTGISLLAGKWLAGNGLLSGVLRKTVKWGADRLMGRDGDNEQNNLERLSSGIRSFVSKFFKKNPQVNDDAVAAV